MTKPDSSEKCDPFRVIFSVQGGIRSDSERVGSMARPGGVLLLRRTCLSGLLSTLTARSHQTPSRLLGGSISSTTTTTSFQQNGINLARFDIFLVSSNFSRQYQLWRQDNLFWLLNHQPPVIDPHPSSPPLAPPSSRRLNVS